MTSPLPRIIADARAALRRQDYTRVESLCAKPLKSFDPAAVLLVAQARSEQGRRDDALTLLRSAVKKQPTAIALHVALGNQLAASGRFAAAHKAFDAALAHDRTHVAALAGKASLWERQGRTDNVSALLAPHVAGAATPPPLAAIELRRLVEVGDTDDAISLGEAVAAARDRPSMALRDLVFSLARAYEERGADGDDERAFRAAERANTMLRPAFDARDMQTRLEGLRASHTNGLPRADLDGSSAVFIVGLPRCGSTLVERILAAHPAVFGAGEIPNFHTIAHELTGQQISARRATEYGGRYLEEIRAMADPGDLRIVNKDLGVGVHLGLVNALLPGARVIHCRRNAIDHCLACWMERLRPSAAPYATDLRDMGTYYRMYEAHLDHWRETLDLRIVDVQYEEVVEDPERAARMLIGFLELEWDDACLSSHESSRTDRTLSHAQVRKPVYRSSLNRAARYGQWLGPLREALGGAYGA